MLTPRKVVTSVTGVPALSPHDLQSASRTSHREGSSSNATRIQPHTVTAETRHTFALRWFCVATFVAWRRTDMLTKQEQRDFRNQLGDVWFLLATLLGHRSAEVTRSVYLEPFQVLQVEELIALMDADDRQSLERLVAAVGVGEPRVLTVQT
jgi:hypothetical protein